MKKLIVFSVLPVLVLSSCLAPRTITNSGKVTPRGNLVVGSSVNGNVGTQTLSALADVVKDNVKALAGMDTIRFDHNLELITRAATAWSLDPLSYGGDFFLRYGLVDRLDAGFKLAGGTKVFDMQYQFMGPLGNIADETDERWYGSAGLQFSTQKYELPGVLDDIKDRLGYKYRRTDLMLPVIFSYSFGNEEKYGAISGGISLNYAHISYSSLPVNIFTAEGIQLAGVNKTQNYIGYGAFLNMKAGYRFVYLIPALSVWYQNYGEYSFLGNDAYALKGWTIVPSLGLKFRIGRSSVSRN